MKRVLIIGGGISGLAAAHRLIELSRNASQPLELTLLEATSRCGGTVKTEHRDGFLLERGPDAFISEKPQALNLSQRLGLEPQLIQTNEKHRRSFIVRHGKLRPLPAGFSLLAPVQVASFLRSNICSWIGKTRMAMDLVLPRRHVNGNTDESLSSFVRRRFGQEALDRIAQPMIGGIYTADPETLSLRATMPRFLEMERKHRSVIRALRKDGITKTSSGARYSLFLSFASGMQVLTDKLTEQIAAAGTIKTNSKVSGLRRENGSWNVQLDGGEKLHPDAVCLAVPSYTAAKLLSDVDSNLSDELTSIPYASSATINLAFKREDIPHPLDGFGFVVPFVEQRTVMACTFSSVKFAGRAPDGYELLRVFVGGALQADVMHLCEDHLVDRVLDDLDGLLGIQTEPLFAEVSRWEMSMPQYIMGHLDRVDRIRQRESALTGLALAGNAYSGPGIPDCIRSGEEAAERLFEQL